MSRVKAFYDEANSVNQDPLDDYGVVEMVDASLEMADAHQTLEQELHHLQENEEMVASLEAIACSLEHHQSLTPTEYALVDGALSLGFRGLNVSNETLCPQLNDQETWSCEGLKSIISNIWKAIVATLKRIYEAFRTFFNRFFGQLVTIKGTLGRLKRRAENLSSGRPTQKMTELGGEINRLLLEERILPDSAAIEGAVKQFSDCSRTVLETYVTMVEKTGSQLDTALKAFDPTKPEKSLDKVSEAAAKLDFTGIQNALGKGRLHGSEHRFLSDVSVGPALLNGRALFFYNTVKPAKESTSLAYAERLRGRHFALHQWRPTKVEPRQSGKIKTLEIRHILSIIAECMDMIAMVERHEAKIGYLERTAKKLETTGASLTAKMEKEVDVAGSEAYYRSAVGFTTAYARWVTSPQTAICDQTLTVVRGMITICNKCLSNYEL